MMSSDEEEEEIVQDTKGISLIEGKEEEETTEKKPQDGKNSGFPLRVLYCGVCGLPSEYCEFGPTFEKCKPWMQENCPDIYATIVEPSQETTDTKSSKRGGKALAKAEPDANVQILPGGKVKKKEKPTNYIYLTYSTKQEKICDRSERTRKIRS